MQNGAIVHQLHVVLPFGTRSTKPSATDPDMNKSQRKGAATRTAGKTRRNGGKVVGSRKQLAQGLAKESPDKVQRRSGDAEKALAAPANRMTSRHTTSRTTTTRGRAR